MKLLIFSQLLTEKGIPFTRRHIRNLVKEGKFPEPLKLTSHGRIVWEENKVDEWLQARGGAPPPRPSRPEVGNIGALFRRQ